MTLDLKPGDKVIYADHHWTMENWQAGVVIKVTPRTVTIQNGIGSRMDRDKVRAVVPPETDLEDLLGFIRASVMDRDKKIHAARVQHTQDVFEYANARRSDP